jgi:tripartite-type tricarboxylate transporter receptor subunit TctC
MKRAFLGRMLALSLAALSVPALAADAWPSKPIRFIVPYPPGGPVDSIVRLVQPKLAKELGQPVVIENKAGASGLIGIQQTVQAEPDGYTFGVGVLGIFAVLPATGKLPFKLEDVNYVTLMTQSPHVLAVNAAGPYKDLKSLIEAARKAPGKLNYGSPGTGSSTHLDGELLEDQAKIAMVHVPYKGGAQAITALLGDEIQLLAAEISAVQSMSGKVRVVAVMGNKRAPTLPDVPTTAELGYPEVVASSIYGVIAPTKTPAAITEKFRQAMTTVLNDPEIKAKLASQGQAATPSTPTEYRKLMEEQAVKWARLIKSKNIKLD